MEYSAAKSVSISCLTLRVITWCSLVQWRWGKFPALCSGTILTNTIQRNCVWGDEGFTNSQYSELAQSPSSYCLADINLSFLRLKFLPLLLMEWHTQQWIELYDPYVVCTAEILLEEFPEKHRSFTQRSAPVKHIRETGKEFFSWHGTVLRVWMRPWWLCSIVRFMICGFNFPLYLTWNL